jgi:hypothetical protein
MGRTLLATLSAVFGALLWAPSSSFGATTYVAYIGCGATGETPALDVCLIGEEPGAFFESTEEEVEYEVCVTYPEGETPCAEEPGSSKACRSVPGAPGWTRNQCP